MNIKTNQYWDEYSYLQHTKHNIIREYLNGWFPKLGFWSGKILYIDTHAGRGKHSSGEEGSPLVALNTFLSHSSMEKIIEKSEVYFLFIERDDENHKNLIEEIKKIQIPTSHVHVSTLNIDSFQFLNDLNTYLATHNKLLPPCFMFVDPFGFKIPCKTLSEIMKNPKSEILMTLMWRELDMSIMNEEKTESMTQTLNDIFGCESWVNISKISQSDKRADSAVDLLKNQIHAKWVTYMRMVDHGRTRYLLLHFTNNDKGRDLIKNVLWKCCPDGNWYANKTDDPNQPLLFKPEPDLIALEQWLIEKLNHKDYTWIELKELLIEEMWLSKHLWEVIRNLRKEPKIQAYNFEGKFSQKSNPTFKLVST